jgi:hypothetical protein
MQKNNVTRSQNNQQAKLSATIASDNATALQKLFAAMKLLEIEMQSKFNPALKEQSKEFQNLSLQHKTLQDQYGRTARATGVMGKSMNSMYGQTFQLTQVMRELPNFAIDARIGFMALSNNLPMLADSFKQLKQQIIDTEGAAGAGRKTWAAFGKSLLSLNTIMIVVSTALVLFGDDLIELVSSLGSAAKATDFFSESLSKLKDNVFGRMVEDANKIMQFTLDYYSARKKGDKKVIKALEEKGAKEFGLHKEQLDMIAENVNSWRVAFDSYLKMAQITYQNEFRLKAGAEAEFNAKRAASQRDQAEQDLRGYLKTKYKGTPGGMTAQEGIENTIKQMREGKTTGLVGVAGELEERWAAANKEVIKFNESLEELKKISVTAIVPKITPKKDKSTGGKEMQDGSDFDIKRKFYDEELVAMRTRAAELEEQIDNKLTDNTVVFYTERKNAIQELFDLKQKLQLHEQSLDEEAIIENDKAEKKKLQDKKDNNEQLYKEGKLSKVKLLELNKQYEEALTILDENTTASLFETADKYIVQTEKDAQKSVELILKYFEQVQGAMPTPEGGIKTPTVGVNIKGGGVAPASPSKVTDRGGKEAGQLPANALEDMLNKEADLYERGLSTYENYTKKKNEILDAANVQAKDFSAETNQRITDIEFDRGQTQIEIAQMTVDAISQIWEAFYAMQEEKIDKQLKRDTKVNDEKLKQYEDETEVGMHTQKELSDFKERNIAYQTSLEEEAARKKAELEKQNFIAQQAFTVAQIWLEYAKAQQAIIFAAQAFTVGAPAYIVSASALNLGTAIASTAVALAQTIPAFAEGGIMDKSGKALLGDGGKRELAISPSGNFFISKDTPTMYNLEKGTQIRPDVNKVDLMSILALKQVMPNMGGKGDDKLMRELISTVKGQKQGNFYGLPLIRQMNMGDRYSARKRSLMN